MLVGQTLSVVKMKTVTSKELTDGCALLCRAWEPIQCNNGHVVLITRRNVYYNQVLGSFNYINLHATEMKYPIMDTRCAICNSHIFNPYKIGRCSSANFHVRGELKFIEEQLREETEED
jgi:hypothetical protein